MCPIGGNRSLRRQDRLMKAIESVFRLNASRCCSSLEGFALGDMKVWRAVSLTHLVGDMRLLIIAVSAMMSARFAGAGSRAGLITLRRLDTRGTAELVEAMLGPVGRRRGLAKAASGRTEQCLLPGGTVRALAEDRTVEFDRSGPLPAQILTGGVQGIVRRRLNRVPEDARPLLEPAAIAGRDSIWM